ncbi:MAG: cytochrome c [Gammaproteobacteria bacterium]|nr:cytochrome c [Gammaproteobacteria bacterium]
MKVRAIIAATILMPSVAFAWPWSTDMMNQPSIKPQEGLMTPFPERSIPVQGIPTKVANRDEAKPLTNPIPVSPASLKKGRDLFRIYCAACHGLTGAADSPVSGKIGAIPLNDSYVQETLTEGWVWGTITFGSYVMPAYGVPRANATSRGSNDLSVEERWHVVNYVKHGLVKEQEDATRSAAASK